jgi:hypothetical protein
VSLSQPRSLLRPAAGVRRRGGRAGQGDGVPAAERSEVSRPRWSAADLAAQAEGEGLVESVSASTVRRWLDGDAIRPWRYRSCIFPCDPDFEVRAGRVPNLYQRIWDGCELGEDEYVISSDEKPGIQVLSRNHGGLPPGPRRAGRYEFEYRRNGTVAYLAAYDVHRAHLMGSPGPACLPCQVRNNVHAVGPHPEGAAFPAAQPTGRPVRVIKIP